MYTIRKTGRQVSSVDLVLMERRGMSEYEIAVDLGISRQALYKLRCKMGWPQGVRSDKGRRHERKK